MTVDEEQNAARRPASYTFSRCKLGQQSVVLPLTSDSTYPLAGMVLLAQSMSRR